MVPFAHGRWLSSQLPLPRSIWNRARIDFSISLGAIGRMLDELVEAHESS